MVFECETVAACSFVVSPGVLHCMRLALLSDTTCDKTWLRFLSEGFCTCRARVIMDQDGIRRLEATDESVHLKSDRRALHRLSTPDWLVDVHMPSMQLLKMQMPQMNFSGFARRLGENKSKQIQHEEAV